MRRENPDFSCMYLDEPVTAGDFERWLARMAAQPGMTNRVYVFAGLTPLDGDALAAILDAEDGLSEADAAELQDRLKSLGYL